MKTFYLLFSLLFITATGRAQLNAEFTWCPVFDTTAQLCCIQFQDQSTDTGGTIINYFYIFGDGQESTSKDPEHCYVVLGSYVVALLVTDISGDVDTVYHNINITHLDSTGCNCNSIGVNDLATHQWNSRVAPNPFHSTALISWNLQQQIVVNKFLFRIYSITGSLLRESILPVINGIGEAKIEQGDLVEGMYFYELRKIQDYGDNSPSDGEPMDKGKFIID